MNKLLLVLFVLALSSPAVAQQAFSTLEEQMTGKEFTDWVGKEEKRHEELMKAAGFMAAKQ